MSPADPHSVPGLGDAEAPSVSGDGIKIHRRFSLVDEILVEWRDEISGDYDGYRNHVYRMINYCLALRACEAEERERIVIAGCFHDLGIWAAGTFDYLDPSAELASEYLRGQGLEAWIPEITSMIEFHHKLRRHEDTRQPLIEVFRRGDLVDVSLGLVRFGLPAAFVAEVKREFPNAGFHRRLVRLSAGWLARHPLRPVPAMKW